MARERRVHEEEPLEGESSLGEGFPEEGDDVGDDEPYSYDWEPAGWIRVGDRDQAKHPLEYREVDVRDEVRRMALFGSGVAELTRHRAEQLARDLVERSKQNRDELMKLVRGEIQNQIQSLGVATKRDLERLERRVTRVEGQLKELGQKKTAAKKTTAKKSAARSSTTKSS